MHQIKQDSEIVILSTLYGLNYTIAIEEHFWFSLIMHGLISSKLICFFYIQDILELILILLHNERVGVRSSTKTDEENLNRIDFLH